MTTSLAAERKAATYAAPGRYYTASPGTSRTILKNFTAPMTPRYYGGGTGGFRSYSPGQRATLRGAGQTASMIGANLAKSAISKAFPATSAAFSNALGLTVTQSLPGHAGAFGTTTVATKLGATLTKAMPYVAAAVSFFTTQGSTGRKAGNAAATLVASKLMLAPDPTGITKAIAVAIMGIQMLVGMYGGKGKRNIGIQAIGLPENAPAILQRQDIGKGVTTLKHYRDFTGHWKDTARPIAAAGDFTQQRLKSLSRIFPGIMDVSDALAKQRDVMYGPSSSQQAAFGNIQTYVDALYRAEGFIENLFADKMVQGYIGRKTNMSFEDFKKGWDFSTELNMTQRFKIPSVESAMEKAWGSASKPLYRTPSYGYAGGTQYQTTIYTDGPSQVSQSVKDLVGNWERTPTGEMGKIITPGIPAGYIGGSQAQTQGRPAEYGSRISMSQYNKMVADAQAKVRKGIEEPYQKQLQVHKDFLASTPQFGSYTYFRPFQSNWTPGMPQIGLSEDAPGPDIDTLKPVLNIQDDPFTYGGMGGGSGYPQTRFGGITIPRASQGKMARQA